MTQELIWHFTKLQTNKGEVEPRRILAIESYVVSGIYIIFAIICWFFFYHHPAERDLTIKEKLIDKDRPNVSEMS